MQHPDQEALELSQQDGAVRLRVRVCPRASRERLLGTHDGALKVGLTAPPVQGAANAALVKLLAKKLGVARSALTISAGSQGRNKTLRIEGMDLAGVRARLGVEASEARQ